MSASTNFADPSEELWHQIKLSAACAFDGGNEDEAPAPEKIMAIFERSESVARSVCPGNDEAAAGLPPRGDAPVDPRVWRKGAWVRAGASCDEETVASMCGLCKSLSHCSAHAFARAFHGDTARASMGTVI